jgi:hypothetical protein
MAKVAVLVLADTETRKGLGRAVNAMIATKEFKDAGDEVRLIFDGAATKWVGELAKPDHRYHELFEAVRDRVAVLAATARRPTAPNRTSTASRSPRWTRTSITRSCVGWWPRASRSSPSSRPGGTVRSHHLAEMVRTAPWAASKGRWDGPARASGRGPRDDPGKRVGVEDMDVGVGHGDGPVGLEILTALLTGCLCMPRMAASVG